MSEENKIDVKNVVAPVEETVEVVNEQLEVKENINDQAADVANEALEKIDEEINQISDDDLKELNSKTLKEILQAFEDLIARGDQQEMYKYADAIKAIFYKSLKKERLALDLVFSQEGVVEGEEHLQEVEVSNNPFAEIERGFKDLYAKYRSLRSSYVQDIERKKEEALVVKQNIIEELRNLVETQEDINRTFPAFRALQTRWRESGPVPQAKVKDVYETYQHYVEMFYDYVKINNELRDLDFKKNLESKEELCAKAEALVEEENIVNAFAQLQKLHEEWKEFGPVAKESREEIWDRFKAATSAINKKHQQFFEKLKVDQKDNLAAKTTLCEKAEEIAAREIVDSNKWNNASKELETLQKEWKGIGFASKKDNQKIYDRFRAACDTFYSNKREYYSQFKDQLTENMQKKISLCEQAEALKESTDWKKTTDKLINLQKVWKETGPVSRKKSDQIWNRFRAACDVFFDSKEKALGGQGAEFAENLEQKEKLIEDIRNFVLSGNSYEDMRVFKEFHRRWSQIGFVPFKDKERIASEFKEVMNTIFEGFRLPKGGNRAPKGDGTREYGGVRSERDRLVQKFRKIESEIATYENNMGFFANSKNAESLINEMKKKIEDAKNELLDIEGKINSIDNQE